MKRDLKLLSCVIFAVCIVAATGHTDTLHVPADYSTIQSAINRAMDGDTVLVAPGTYIENIDFKGKVITLLSEQGAALTVIDGNQVGTVVTCLSGEGPSSVLDGFTIANGTSFSGVGGMGNWNNSSPTVTNCVFTNNSVGMYNNSSSPSVMDCTFIGNSYTGMTNDLSSPTVSRCIFSEQGYGGFPGGGAMRNGTYSNPTVSNCIFKDNCAGRGGGMFNESSSPIIINCFFANNKAIGNGYEDPGEGGGMCNWLDSNPMVTNCIFIENYAFHALGGGCGIGNRESCPTITNCTFSENYYDGIHNWNCNPTITNCILWNNHFINDSYSNPTVTFCCIGGGYPGVGNIDSDPIFVDPANGDFHLSQIASGQLEDSLCVDTGDSESLMILGSTRTDGAYDFGVVDMGYHYPCMEIKVPDEYSSIQEAINTAADGTLIQVGPGTYVENVDFIGKTIMVISTNGPNATIIDGSQSGSVVTFQNGESQDSYLSGFTITNGLAQFGGGLYCNGTSPSILESIIISNTSVEQGGGIACFSSYPLIDKIDIHANIADSGAGIYCSESSPVINKCNVLDNSAYAEGGGLFASGVSSPIITNTLFCGNTADCGGGLFSDNTSVPTITNNTLYANSAVNQGGGVYCGTGYPVITNTILWNNSAQVGPQIEGMDPIVTYCDIQGGYTGTGNIDSDPFFKAAGKRNFHITWYSPCINRGDNLALGLPDTDFEGDLRIIGQGVDMGIDERRMGDRPYLPFTESKPDQEQWPTNTLHVPSKYASIQKAINFANDKDLVLVEPGYYEENINFKGKAITVKSSGGAQITVIDGQQSGNVVTFIKGEGKDSILDGFTIMNGYQGIRCDFCTPTIRNNIIKENYDSGIYCEGSSPDIVDNVISSNSQSGVICASASSPTIADNLIFNNNGSMGGGIRCLVDCNPAIANCTIVNNSADSGGGLFFNTSCSLFIRNSIIWNNEAYIGPQIFVSLSTLNINYSDVQEGEDGIFLWLATLNWGSGMIDDDPLFVESAHGDFHLTFPSPCKDTGDNTAVTGLTDFEGDPRIAYGNVDMGADEFYPHLYVTGDKIPGGAIQVKLVGLPGTTPVGLFIGSSVLPSPKNTMWGEFWLQAPWDLLGLFGSIPSDGIMVLPMTLPGSIPAPYYVPMQALIGLNQNSLTNFNVLEVR